MKKNEVCVVCHLEKSLVEEAIKHPYGGGWAHRACIALIELKLGKNRGKGVENE